MGFLPVLNGNCRTNADNPKGCTDWKSMLLGESSYGAD